MDEFWSRFALDFGVRFDGPMKLRLLVQPAMAILLALRAGLADARAGRAPFFWSVLSRPEERRALLADGWKDIGKVFLLAVALDLVYQFIDAGSLRPLEAILVGAVLAILPYLVVRGAANRLSAHGQRSAAARGRHP